MNRLLIHRDQGARARLLRGLLCAALTGLLWTGSAAAQGISPTGVIKVASGNSHLIMHPVNLNRVSIGDPEVADAVVVSPREIVINGKETGTTTLLLWDNAGGREMYTVRVTPDAATLEADLNLLFPDDVATVEATGNTVVITGTVSEGLTATKMLAIASGALPEGVIIVDNISVPEPKQILLNVRFAEVGRNAMEELGVNMLGTGTTKFHTSSGNPPAPGGGFLEGSGPDQQFSDAVNLFLFSPNANLGVFIQALQSRGLFKSLAEPNLMAVDGEEATFLAGGEFPFPIVQGGGVTNAVTIQFKEFGIRLDFTPTVTNSGNIRLHVAPEVSALDFSNGLEFAGFLIPSLLVRRAETEIELMDGQTFAIAGLIDNSMVDNISKVPLLGDIPILGALFRSKDLRQRRSELLVLVTPHLVEPLDEAPPVPTGEPEDWKWMETMDGPADTLGMKKPDTNP